ncbi:MAG: methyltransferase domain-containing protein [Desulfobacterales bacterium]
MITVDFNRLDIRPGYRILDIGCGSGRHTCAAYRFKNVVAIGADINHADLVEAKNRLKFHDQLGENGGGIWGLTMADVNALPFEDHFFDLVICSEVLEHVSEDENAARELIRVLKPGHNLVISVPRLWPERVCWAFSSEYSNSNNGHIRIYRKKKLMALLENYGVKRWAFHYAHSLHTPYWWLKCLLGPKRNDATLVNLYQRFLFWDIMKKPKIVEWMDRLLNPVLGKSLVVYFKKEKNAGLNAINNWPIGRRKRSVRGIHFFR